MDFKDLLEKSWKSFTEFLPPLLINTVVLLVVSIFSLGFLAPVCTAGYTQSLLQTIRDKRKPEVGDLFSHMNLFFPLLAFFIVAGIIMFIGLLVLVLPGIIAGLALYFFCLYLIPLMTDKDMGLVEAVKESSRMAMEDPVTEHVAVVAIYIGLTAIGQVVPFGIIFTMPIATLFLLYAFEEKCGAEEKPSEKIEEAEATSPPPPPPQPENDEETPMPSKEEVTADSNQNEVTSETDELENEVTSEPDEKK